MRDDRIDACLRLLADRRRRGVIHHLRDEATAVTTVDDLTDRLHGTTSVSGSDRQRDREELATELTHTHLPKLADYGVVEYDRRSGAVRYHADEQIEALLDSLPEEIAPASP